MGEQISASEKGRPSIRQIDGLQLQRAFAAASQWLDQKAAAINSLNVFPVPDGDTGTNMSLTLQAASQECQKPDERNIGAVANAAAYGALMGARGNSGVILSQIIRGFARVLHDREQATTEDLANAFTEASNTAYKGVAKPVEGTILTVARETAEAAVVAAREHRDIIAFMEQCVIAAHASVARTPQLNAVLRNAGVVDSGGQGLFVLLEGVLRYLKGELNVAETAAPEAQLQAGDHEQRGILNPMFQGESYGYCTEFILGGQNMDFDSLRSKVLESGDSAIVVGDDTLIKVHVHTFRPGALLDFATGLGTLLKVKIENMQQQYNEYTMVGPSATEAMEREGYLVPPVDAEEQHEAVTPIALIAVVAGAGLTDVFKSLGATEIVSGGQTMNPSIQELLQAIERVPQQEVIVLPNNGNIVLTAQQTVPLAQKQVRVVPTTTIPQGISALLAFNFDAGLDQNAAAMEEAGKNVTTLEITTAVRSVAVDGSKVYVNVEAGQLIGLLDDRLVAVGNSSADVALEMLQKAVTPEREVITLYYGENISGDDAETLAAQVREHYPAMQVEVIDGGQPHYQYIISVE